MRRIEIDSKILKLFNLASTKDRIPNKHKLLARRGTPIVSKFEACLIWSLISSFASFTVKKHTIHLVSEVVLPVLKILAMAVLKSYRNH